MIYCFPEKSNQEKDFWMERVRLVGGNENV